jgi:hypothetical protein
VSEVGKSHCKAINGNCVIERDGYYIVTTAGMIFGIVFLVGFIYPSARKLQCKFHGLTDANQLTYAFAALPTSAWRLKQL